ARRRIREALLKQHHHQNHKKLANRIPIVRSFADIGKKQSEPHSMDKNGQTVSPQSQPAKHRGQARCESGKTAQWDFSKIDLHFMKKIPAGAEASNVLVGELEFLERPVVAFVRLAPAVLLNGLAEEVRFILRGPLGKGAAVSTTRSRRSIATLMTDEESGGAALPNGLTGPELEDQEGHGGPELTPRTGRWLSVWVRAGCGVGKSESERNE
ncbi:unnamed protein product, partial [Arctogadus glacialis]